MCLTLLELGIVRMSHCMLCIHVCVIAIGVIYKSEAVSLIHVHVVPGCKDNIIHVVSIFLLWVFTVHV